LDFFGVSYLGLKPCLLYTSPARIRASVACDLILYLLLLKEKEDDSGPGCP